MEKHNSISEEGLEQERLAQITIKQAIEETLRRGNPVARYDLELKKPYFQYPDGRREYDLD